MKKIGVLLAVLSMFSLIGCNKDEVSYKEVENLDEYFTSEKVSESKEALKHKEKFAFSSKQKYAGTEYNYQILLDHQYMYLKSSMMHPKESAETSSKGQELYLGNDSELDECKYYSVVLQEGKDTTYDYKIGQTAKSYYEDKLNNTTRMLERNLDNPTFLLSNYVDGDTVTYSYFVGSNKTLKVISKNAENKQLGYVIIDSNTLFVKSLKASYSVSVTTVSIEISFSFPNSVKHKTPNEIGYKVIPQAQNEK